MMHSSNSIDSCARIVMNAAGLLATSYALKKQLKPSEALAAVLIHYAALSLFEQMIRGERVCHFRLKSSYSRLFLLDAAAATTAALAMALLFSKSKSALLPLVLGSFLASHIPRMIDCTFRFSNRVD